MKGPEDFRERIKVAKKEAKVAKQKIQETAPVDVSDKHPVSALMELCQKRGWQVGVKGGKPKISRKTFFLECIHANMWEKWDVKMKKLNFFNGILAIKGAEATVYFQRITRI